MVRKDGRGAEEPREAKISHNIQEYAEGSVLIEVGATKIICAVSIENGSPTNSCLVAPSYSGPSNSSVVIESKP